MFNTIITADQILLPQFLFCVGVALLLGVFTALVFTAGVRHSSSFALSIALLPAVVTVVIMVVNGNIGAGLAVAGTFALVRFRSNPGTGREITGLFFAVAIGLLCGMGYLGFAAIFFIIMSVATVLLTSCGFGSTVKNIRILRITIPEDLDYEDVFQDLLTKYTSHTELVRVKTSSMGTLFDLTYEVTLKPDISTKAFLDDIRCRNGNLTVSLSREKAGENEL